VRAPRSRGTSWTSASGSAGDALAGASFADALDALPVVAFVATPDGDVEYVSRGWTVLTGYTGLEALGAGYRCAFEPDDVDRLAVIWRERPAGNATYGGEYRLRLRDGRRRWVRIEIAAVLEPADGGLRAWLGTMINIDDSKRIASELREREAAYRAFAGAVPGNTWTASPAGDLTFIGHDWQEIDPNQATRALGRAWLNQVHDDDRERVRARWDNAIRTGEPYEAEFRVLVDGEQYRWLRVRAMPVRDERGVIVRWIGINLDIHDAHSADHARDMYASLVGRSWNFIAISDPDGRVEYINAAARELIGIASIDACRGNPMFDFFDPADRAAVEGDAIAALRESGRWRGTCICGTSRPGAASPSRASRSCSSPMTGRCSVSPRCATINVRSNGSRMGCGCSRARARRSSIRSTINARSIISPTRFSTTSPRCA
jgi:PAS domain S-box-containing protein